MMNAERGTMSKKFRVQRSSFIVAFQRRRVNSNVRRLSVISI